MYKFKQPFMNEFLSRRHSGVQFAEALPVLPTEFPATQSIRNTVFHALNVYRSNLEFTSGSHQLQLPEATLQERVVCPACIEHWHWSFVTLNHNSQPTPCGQPHSQSAVQGRLYQNSYWQRSLETVHGNTPAESEAMPRSLVYMHPSPPPHLAPTTFTMASLTPRCIGEETPSTTTDLSWHFQVPQPFRPWAGLAKTPAPLTWTIILV